MQGIRMDTCVLILESSLKYHILIWLRVWCSLVAELRNECL